MKRFLYVALGMVLFNACSDRPKSTGWSEEDLKGRVKTASIKASYLADSSGIVAEEKVAFVTTIDFDDKGDRTQKNVYSSNGSLFSKNIYNYDAKAKQLEVGIYDGDDGSLLMKIISKYDSKGNKVEENRCFSEGSSCVKHVYKYDNKGNRVEESLYDVDGNLENKNICTYDSKGNRIEENCYAIDGSLSWKSVNTYDDKGNLIEWSRYASDGSLWQKAIHKYDYDKRGNWIVKTTYENDAPTYVEVREIEYFD